MLPDFFTRGVYVLVEGVTFDEKGFGSLEYQYQCGVLERLPFLKGTRNGTSVKDNLCILLVRYMDGRTHVCVCECMYGENT